MMIMTDPKKGIWIVPDTRNYPNAFPGVGNDHHDYVKHETNLTGSGDGRFQSIHRVERFAEKNERWGQTL